MIDKQQIFHISPEVFSQAIDDEIILLDMKSEHYFGLNDVGAAVFKILTQGATVEMLVHHLLEKYEVDQRQLENDIIELLQDLLSAGLILPKAP